MRRFLKIDGTSYDVVTGIKRVAEIKPSEISGMLLDKRYFNDVIGTYLRYTISVAIPYGKEDQYEGLYEVLSNPVSDHHVILPYNQTTVEIVGRIETISDTFFRQERRGGDIINIWRSITFDVIANHPTKEMSLDEVISRGVSMYPDVSELDAGKVYYYNKYGEWVTSRLRIADENYY